MSMGRKQGENVRLSLTSADASAGVKIVVADANGVDRPIQSYERLVIDSLEIEAASAALALVLSDPGAGVSSDAVNLLGFVQPFSEWHTDGEGLSISVGSTPVLTAGHSGALVLGGTGRVVTGGTRGESAGYKALLTPGGNVNWQMILMFVVMSIVLVLAGCSHQPVPPYQPQVTMVDLAGNADGGPKLLGWWKAEVARRFPDAVVIVAHGNTIVDGEWVVEATGKIEHIERVVAKYQVIYPGRLIVLISCNPHHLRLNMPGVFYALENVNMVPDKDIPEYEVGAGPAPTNYTHAGVGNIFEFVEGRRVPS